MVFVAVLGYALLKASVDDAAAENAHVFCTRGHNRTENQSLGVNVDHVVVPEIYGAGKMDARAEIEGHVSGACFLPDGVEKDVERVVHSVDFEHVAATVGESEYDLVPIYYGGDVF